MSNATSEGTLRFLKRQEFHIIFQVLEFARLSDDVEITDALGDGNPEGVSIQHAAERLAGPLTISGFGQQVIIERKEHPAKSTGAVEKLGVGITLPTVFLGGQNIDTL